MAGDHEPERSDEAEGGPVKTFLEHLEDFRWVLIKSLVALFVAMLVCLVGASHVVQIIKWPLEHPLLKWPGQVHNPGPGRDQPVAVNFGTNHLGDLQLTPALRQSLNLGSNSPAAMDLEPLLIGTNHVLGWRLDTDASAGAASGRHGIELINLSPASGFVIAFQVALYGGAVLAAPFIFYFVASFVFPALKLRERKYVYRGLAFGGGLFFLGVAFCYFVLMPLALVAAQKYSQWLGFGAYQWQAENYISFVCKFMLGMGLGFELPVVLLTLVKIGVLDYQMLSGARRYMIIINLVLGAVLTTPEVITQLVMFLPLQALYEITVWIAWYWDRQERKRALHPVD
ncbi:MAG: twin-arginine translocase subunit TatC [Verrucomicrobiota bacterium]|nr:twin-arginine translocase subunit TatC [Verrucomicrobiota bacterium]